MNVYYERNLNNNPQWISYEQFWKDVYDAAKEHGLDLDAEEAEDSKKDPYYFIGTMHNTGTGSKRRDLWLLNS